MIGKHVAEGPPEESAQAADSTEADSIVAGNTVTGSTELPASEEEAEGTVPGERTGRRHRRVRTAAVPGSDPTPAPEPRRHAPTENDDRLRADKPPHWRSDA
jgi:hypothetical protein